MRIAYIILAHRLPQQLARLIDSLSDGDDAFFIHLDKSSDRRNGLSVKEAFLGALITRPDVTLLQRRTCYWGSFGIVEATLDGINAIVASRSKFDRVILLSGQDYPIKPTAEIKGYLHRHAKTEFIESFPLTESNRWTNQQGPFNALARAMHWHLRFRSKTLHIPLRRPLPWGFLPYGGSQWWALSFECISYIHELLNRDGRLISHFRYSFIPDELFFQTILSNSRFAEQLSGHDVTYADWSKPVPPYPAILGGSDISALSTSTRLFARKFDVQKDAEVLDMIDSRLLHRERHRTRAAEMNVRGKGAPSSLQVA